MLQGYAPGTDLVALPPEATFTLWFGLNDVSALGGGSHLEPFAQAMTTMISRLDSVAVRDADDPSISVPTGWTYQAGVERNSGDGVLVADQPGRPLTINVPTAFQGGTIALGFTATTTSSSPTGQAVYTVSVDGRTAPDYAIDGSMVTPLLSGSGGAIGTVDRIGGLAPGPHRITVSLASTNGTISTGFNYWQAEAPIGNARPVIVPLQYYASAAGYSQYAPYGYVPNDDDVTALNELIREVVAQFPANVQSVQLDLGDDLDNFYLDQLHPSNAGYELIAQQVLSALKTVSLTATPAPGFSFEGWSGAGCSGTASCVVSLSSPASVRASFTDPNPRQPAGVGLLAARHRRDGTLVIDLSVPGRGRLTVIARYADRSRSYTFASSRTRTRGAETATIALRPTKAALKLLAAGRRLHVLITIEFTAAGAAHGRERTLRMTDGIGG